MSGYRQRIIRRQPVNEHEGASGATLERALLPDGTWFILKTVDAARDITVAITRDGTVREIELWRAGVLDRLPSGLSHAVMDTWQEGESDVIAMRDLTGSMLGWDSVLDRATLRGIFAAATGMHRAMRDERSPHLMSFEERVSLFSRRVVSPLAGHPTGLPQGILEGWDRFGHLVPPEVSDLVFRIHDDPTVITRPLAEARLTMIHGDLWVNNIALEPNRVTLIDWALATRASPILEFVSFLAGCADQVDASHDEVIEDIRWAMGEDFPAGALPTALVMGLVEMGWNLALQVTEGEASRAAESLDWWVGRAREAIVRGL